MAKVEIEESELESLRRVNKFAETALSSDKTRRKMLEIQKTLNPTQPIPEIDESERVMQSVSKVEEKFDALMKKLEEKETKFEEERATSAAQKRIQDGERYLAEQGYTPEGIKTITDFMVKENIPSYAAALAYYEKLNPPQAPADNSRMSVMDEVFSRDDKGPDFKELVDSQGHSEKWLRESLAHVRKDYRQ